MTRLGTDQYSADTTYYPPLVAAAVEASRRTGFELSCLPEHGELLRVLARGVGPGRIGETGTGCGVGLAWLVTGAHPQAALVSVELDAERAAVAAGVFAAEPRAEVLSGDWKLLEAEGPFDLLVLDGGGQGKKSEPPAELPGAAKQGGQRGPEAPLDPARWLRPGGLLVIDDFTPSTGWPPMYGSEVDTARLHWMDHPQLKAAEVRVTPAASVIVATFVG
nr:transferase [Longispora albida]